MRTTLTFNGLRPLHQRFITQRLWKTFRKLWPVQSWALFLKICQYFLGKKIESCSYSAMKALSFSHLMLLFFLNYANAFLILMEETRNRLVSSIILTSPALSSLIVLYILALLSAGIACPPLELHVRDYFYYVIKTKILCFCQQKQVCYTYRYISMRRK